MGSNNIKFYRTIRRKLSFIILNHHCTSSGLVKTVGFMA